ncbi:DinB family protein [Alkalibacillus haloalkaliphilus]|uniref:DinB family protein n=1 Tax=Alkalibacillus haloalkaliphilus TaxID=94136 RepID=UPI0002F8D45F|nr:DinB family protein [Alkalibacillus haloalkaliphilus]
MEKKHEVLFNQLQTYREGLLHDVNDINKEEAEIIPANFNNNIRWHLGHVFMDQYMWIKVLTKDDLYPDSFQKWFGFGTNPSNFDEHTPTFEELKLLLSEQPQKIKEFYSERLDEVFPSTEMGMFTIEQVLIRTIFHEGMHTQAINDLKRLIKK